MNKFSLVAVLLFSFSSLTAAEKYNPHSKKWETVPEYPQTKYNPQSGKWIYHPKDAKEDRISITYNFDDSTWDWGSGRDD